MRSFAAVAFAVILSASPAAQSAINIPFEAYTLPNGLNVVLSIDRTTPTVAVNLWYHVGSKNEIPGAPGSPTCSST
jgi:predicted Zn-dependent peptidase